MEKIHCSIKLASYMVMPGDSLKAIYDFVRPLKVLHISKVQDNIRKVFKEHFDKSIWSRDFICYIEEDNIYIDLADITLEEIKERHNVIMTIDGDKTKFNMRSL